MPSIYESVPGGAMVICTSREWREQSSRRRLVGCRCKKCKEIYFPRRWACPVCHSNELEDYKLKPRGEVDESSITYGVMDGWEELRPMQGAAIKLEDGPIIAAEIIDAPEELRPGTKVEMVVRKIGRDSLGVRLYGYKFRPTRSSDS